MKKITSFIALLCLAFGLSSCYDKTVYHWKFEQSDNNVSKITIVDISNNSDEETYIILKEINIEYESALFNDIQSINMYRYYGDPLTPSGHSIIIEFSNGEYDVISQFEPTHAKYDSNGVVRNYISWLYFDSAEYEKLIIKYLSIE